jgi:phosphatidylserine decarboxylase
VEFRSSQLSAGPFYSALVGLTARRRLPVPLRNAAYRAFARAVGADLGEAELDLRSYASLGDLFARRLKPGSREVDADPMSIVSPCDGVMAALGAAIDGSLIQAKGKNYSLEELLVDKELADRLTGGDYATIYLSPRDYHRVHTPVDGRQIACSCVTSAS